MENLNNTQYFTVQKEPELQVRDVLEIVFRALSEKRIQSGESDCRIYYVRRSDIYYQS